MAIPSSGYSTADFTNPASDLTDFVAVVDLSDMPADFWTAVDTSDGARGRVAKDDGTTELASEWVEFDDVAETGFVFFKWSGTLSSAGTSTVRIYPPESANSSYAVTNTFGRNNVWTDYEVVLHLNEDPSGTAPQFTDSTGNGYNGTANGSMTSGDVVAAQIGNGIDFDGSDDYISLATDITNQASQPATYQCWINPVDTGDRVNRLFGVDGNEKISINQYDDTHRIGVTTDNGDVDFPNSSTPWGVMAKVDISHDGSAWSCAKDGTYTDTDAFTATFSDNWSEIMGGSLELTQGVLDEWRVRNSQLSGDWLSLEYSNQNDPTTFWGTWTWNSPGTSVSVSDSVSLADSIAEVLNTFTVTDSVSVADTNDFDISFIIADSVSLSDSVNNILNEFTLQDTITANDSVSVSQGVTNITVSDSLSISDSIATVDVIFTVQDAISLLDSVSSVEAQVVVVDTVSFTESLASLSNSLSVSDAISITENITKTTIGDATKMVITAGELYNILLQASEKYNIELEANNLYNIALTALEKIDGMSKVVGEVIPLKASFTDDSDVATTPGEPVEVSVKQPDGTLDIDSVTVSEGTTGVYEYEYTTSQAGQHYYKFVSSDGGVEQGTFFVQKDEVG